MRVELLNGKNIEERVRFIATAGMLSRAKGTVFDLYASRDNYEKNINVAKRIIGMGHKSIIEHDYLVFGISDVSPIIEQILIGQRLASFTVKSRREVDFSTVGYYTPDFNYLDNGKEISDKYHNHMDYLFNEYSKLLELGIKKEDARFILPYSYHSNLVMGVDGRTLEKLINYCTKGKMSVLPEVHELGDKLIEIVNIYCPYLVEELDKVKPNTDDKFEFLDDIVKDTKPADLDKPRLISISNPHFIKTLESGMDEQIIVSALMNRYQISIDDAKKLYDNKLTYDDKNKIMEVICNSSEQRELEQVSFTYQVPISLAVLTHLTRHRMHSLLIPDFIPMWNLDRHIVPNSIKNKCLDTYEAIYEKNNAVFKNFKDNNVEEKDLVYFYLSGNMVNVTTNMNGRTLEWISRMRCCNKAQWEIRNNVNEMVNLAKDVAPLYGKHLGATCDVYGYCPEGKECCGKVYTLKKGE